MARAQIIVTVRFAWWVKPYIATLAWLCNVFNTAPNWERFDFWCRCGTKVEVG